MRRAAAALSAAVLLTVQVSAVERTAAPAQPEVSAKSAILMDAGSGRILYEKDADARSRIASTTKILTGLIVCETLDADEEVCVPPEAVGVEGSSMYLRSGERLTVRELLYGMMLHSGNDAATALAILTDGSVERFAQRMNRRAAELGMRDSHFCNPSGLDEDGHFSTAYDLAVLTRAAMRNDRFRELVGTKSITLGARVLTNHNRLLWSYAGADGVKTGYTRAAGRILVSSAERGGRRLIAVTICAPNDWKDHAALLDYGFSAFEHRVFLRSGAAAGNVPVVGGVLDRTELTAGETLSYPLAEGEQAEVRIHAEKFRFAPVLPGLAGYAELIVNGEAVRRVPLYYKNAVAALPQKGLFARLFGG